MGVIIGAAGGYANPGPSYCGMCQSGCSSMESGATSLSGDGIMPLPYFVPTFVGLVSI